MVKAYIISALALTLTSVELLAQGQGWTLEQCITYAKENNISIQQSELQVKQQSVEYNTARNSFLPSVSADLGGRTSFGRAQNREGIYDDNTNMSMSGSIGLGLPIYTGGQLKYNLRYRELNLNARVRDLAAAKEDLSISVAKLYMQALYNMELVDISQSQLELSRQKLERSKLLHEGGRSAESDVYDAQSVVANDELALTESKNALRSALLEMAQLLNMEPGSDFSLHMPNLEAIDMAAMRNVDSPANIFAYSQGVRPHVEAENLRLKAVKNQLGMARSARFPQISFGAGYSSGTYHSFQTGAINKPFLDQWNLNGSQYVSLGVSIPIFNKYATRNNIILAKLSIASQELAVTDVKQKLYKEIEQAHLEVVSSYDKYTAATKAADAAQLAFDYGEQKSDAGRATIFDFNDAKTRLEQAQIEAARAKFEFVFMVKILEFYSGNNLGFTSYNN